LFTGLSLLLFFKILHQKENSWTIYALLGLVAGFGVWFAYIYGITVMAMLIFWLLHDRNVFVRRGFALFALFFLIGFSPWIVFNLNNNFSGLFIHGVPFWAHFRWNHFQESLANYWTLTGLFPTLRSPESWPLTPVYSLLFLGIISSHAIFTLWNRPSVKDLYVFSMLYLVLFIAVLLSSYFFSLSYLIPAFPFFFFLAAHSLAEGERRFPPRYRKIPLFFLTALIGGGIYSQTHRFSIPRAGQALRTKGYSYFTAASVPICNDFDCVARRYQTLKPKLDPESLHELSVGAAFDLAGLILPFKNLSEEVDRIQSFNVPPFENYFYYFLGMAALSRNHYHLPSAVEAIEFLKIRSPRFYNLAWRGIALELGYGPADTLIEKPDEFAREIPSSVVSHYWRGVGRELGKYLCARNPSLAGFEESLRDLLKRMDRHHQEDILQGVGASLYVEWSLNPARPPFRPKEIEQFPEEFHHALFQGAGIAFIEDTRTDLAISSNNWLEEAFTESLEPQNQRYFEEGKNTVSKYFVVPEAG